MFFSWCYCFVVFHLLILNIVTHVKSEASDEEWPSVLNLPPAQLNLFRLFSSGITELVWSKDADIQGLDISQDCKTSLLAVLEHINEGSEWAYKGKNIIVTYEYI